MSIYKLVEGLTYAEFAAADLSEKLHHFVSVDTDGHIILAGTAAPVLGTLYEAGKEGEPVSVQFGGIVRVVAGGSVAAGARVASDTNSKAVTAGSATRVVGIALQGGDADEIIPVALVPGQTAA